MTNAIEVRGLSVGFGRFGRKRVLADLELDVEPGSVTALLGRNGAGKTTLLRTLAGELPHARGELRVLGLDPRRRPLDVRRAIGWLPDAQALPAWMRLRELFTFLAPFHPTWDAAEARRLTELFELDEAARLVDLSKGQLTLARLSAVLAPRPRLLLLDEPFSGLDAVARARVFEGVLEHLVETGRSVLVASHSFPDVERCADRVAFLGQHHGASCITRSLDLEELRRSAARFHVVLNTDAADWALPSDFYVERSAGRELAVCGLGDPDALRARLTADPVVVDVGPADWDLERVVTAVLAHGAAA